MDFAENGYEWKFQKEESYLTAGATLILTWELKRVLRGTPCGDQIMAAAQRGSTKDPWYLKIRFVHPTQAFNGNATVFADTYLIQKEIPLGNLQPSYYENGLAYRLQFGVVYQEAPTCITYQAPPDHTIAFMPAPGGGETRPLQWRTPITEETLGQAPADYLEDKTLSDIVNSRTTGRPDGMLCNACHYATASLKYRPPGDQGQPPSQEITPDLAIQSGERSPSTYTWNDAGPSGIVDHFIQTNIKPEPLEAAFLKWLADGALE